jgi:hypothetical protein
MNPEIEIVADAEALYRAGAAAFMRQAREAVEAKGAFTGVGKERCKIPDRPWKSAITRRGDRHLAS